jgi:hypothetical protein
VWGGLGQGEGEEGGREQGCGRESGWDVRFGLFVAEGALPLVRSMATPLPWLLSPSPPRPLAPPHRLSRFHSLPPTALPACRYEQEGRARKVVRAQQLWFSILEAQIETGNPYMLFKDTANRKSNQQVCMWRGEQRGQNGREEQRVGGRGPFLLFFSPATTPTTLIRPSFLPFPVLAQNLGTIKCSNLCTEIIEYTSADETAVCNLASIALPRFVRERDCEADRENKKLVGSLDAGNR